MRAWAVFAVFAAGTLVVAVGCSAALDFDECNSDQDCLGRAAPDGGPALYCTSAHMCIDPTPCTVSVPVTAISDSPTLVIGGLYRLSTGVAVKSISFRHASDLAALQLNVLGVPVTHIACDTAGDPAQAQVAFDLLAEVFHAVAVVGPDTSDEVIRGIAPVVKRHGIVVMSPGATNPTISQLDDDHLIWRTAPSDALQSRVLAQLIPSSATLDVVYLDGSTYATGLEQAFLANWGGTVDRSIVFPSGHAAEAVAQMVAPTDALLIADADAPALVDAVSRLPNLATTRFYMTEAAVGPNLWGPGPTWNFDFLSHFRGTAPGLPPIDPDPSAAVYRGFRSEYTSHFSDNPDSTAFVANAYDAFSSLALAAIAAGDDRSGAAIAANLARLSDPKGASISVGPNGFATALQALARGDAINLRGASGAIDFTESGDVTTAPIQIWDIEKGTDNRPRFGVVAVQTP